MAVKVTVYGTANMKQIEKARLELQKLEDQARKGSSGFSGAMARMGSSMNAAGKSMVSVGESATKYVTLPLMAAAAGLYKATQAAAEDAAAQANLANVLQNTTGATAKQVAAVEDWITAQGKAVAFSDDQLRPSLVNLVSATHDVDKAQKLAAMAMDISRAKGVDLETASKAVAKAYAGQYTALSKMLPGLDQAAIKSKDFGKIQMAVYDTVGGAAQKYADTEAGAQEKARIAFNESIEQLGTAFLPVMTQVTNLITTKVVPAITTLADWYAKLSPAQKNVVLGIAGAAAAFGPMAVVLGKVTQGLGATFTAMSKMPMAFGNVAKGAKALYAVLAANPWVLIATAVAIAAVLIIKNWDKISAFILNAWNKIRSAASTVWNAIVGIVKGAASKVWDAIQAYFNFYKRVAQFGLQIVQGLWDGIRNAAGWIKQKLSEWAGGVLDSLKSAFGIASPSKHTTKQGEELGYGVMQGLTNVEPKVKAKAKSVADNTLKALQSALNKSLATNKSVASNMQSALEKALGGINDQIDRIYSQITDALAASRDAANGMVDAAQERWQSASNALSELRDQAVSFAGTVRDSLRSVFSLRNALNTENGGTFMGNLRDQLKQFTTFAGQVRQLRSMGLNEASMQEIIQAGVEQGTQIAAAILAGGNGAVAEINSLESQITSAASELGNVFAQDKFGAELAKAQDNLNVAAQSLANATAARNMLIEQINAAQAAADRILGKGMDALDSMVAALGTGLTDAASVIGMILGEVKGRTQTLAMMQQLSGGLSAGITTLNNGGTTNKTVTVASGAVQINFNTAARKDAENDAYLNATTAAFNDLLREIQAK